MPLLQCFAWVGGFLLAALFAANWCCSPPVAAAPPSDIPLNQKINIRIKSEHNSLNASYLTRTARSWHPKQQSPLRQTFRQARLWPARGTKLWMHSPR
jgi:hypothetical protein